MRRAGIFEDAFSSPDTNFAKADNLRRRKPARMVYDSMLYIVASLNYTYHISHEI